MKLKVILITTDVHTIGIQTVATIVKKYEGIDSVLVYAPSHLRLYPLTIAEKILNKLNEEILDSYVNIIGFHLKELSLSRSLQILNMLKNSIKYKQMSAVFIAGGTYATLNSKEAGKYFDSVIIGGGIGILKVINAIKENLPIPKYIISGITEYEYPMISEAWVLNQEGNFVKSKWRPLVHAQYKHEKPVEIVAGFGCSYSCPYCEVAVLKRIFAQEYRIVRSEPEKLIELLQNAIDNSDRNYIYFFDEDFLLKPESWINKFAELYKLKIGLPFFIFATPLSLYKYPEKVRKLAEAGLDTVNLGIQSGSNNISSGLFNRRESKEIIMKVLTFLTDLHEKNLISSPPMVDFIILNPYESISDIMDTINLIKHLPTPFNAIMHNMAFFKGTILYNKALKEGIIPKNYSFKYDLHDFCSRIIDNEFHIDYNNKRNLKWLYLNTLLYGMRGLHFIKNGVRYMGSLDENKMENLLNYEPNTLKEVISLACKFPNPMEGVEYTWEAPYRRKGDAKLSAL